MFGLVKESRLYHRLQKRIDECEKIQTRNKELETEIYSLQSQLVEVRKQIREQTEADLFFISAKIQKKLLNGESKENVGDLYFAQKAAPEGLLQMQQQSPYPNSFLQGLGLGGLFGR